MNSRKVFVKTWGCQMNVYDSARMADVLRVLGYETAESAAKADLVLLNTCHIREKAAEKVFSELGRIKMLKERRVAEGRNMLIGVGGCVAEAEGAHILERAPFVDFVFGPRQYHRLPGLVDTALRAAGEDRPVLVGIPEDSKFDALPEDGGQGLCAYLAVQEGCDKFCTYCVVPYTRGAEFSRPAAKILEEARRLAGAGAVEITLLGQNVNAWHGLGTDGRVWSFAKLLRAMAELDGLKRLRYTTSHPLEMEDDLIAAHGELALLMPYLHLPIQSGSDKILAAMNRRHTRDDYLDIVARLRAARPDLALSSDFIVGFPGEKEEDFEDTLDMARRVNYAQAYSFKYSARPNTPAAALPGQVPERVKKERLAALQAVLNESQVAFNTACVDKTLDVLFEDRGNRQGQIHGRTPYLQAVHVDGPESLIGQIAPVKITSAHANSLGGEMAT